MSASRTSSGRANAATMLLGCACCLVLFLGVVGAARAAAPGSLDPSFGSGGIASSGSGTRLFGTAAQSDGKVVAVGESGAGSTADVLVARFTSSGALDPSFGSGGLVQGPAVPTAGGSGSLGRAVAIQPDGKIVVVGKATTADGTGTDGLLIERYNANGGLDHSFGSGGLVNLLSSTYGDGYAVAIQPDGKIVATGAADAAGSGGTFPRVAVARLSSNGSLDPSFGSGGIDVLDLGAYSYAYAVALQGDGKIVIAGSQRPGLQVTNALIARLTSSGARDGSFAGSGAFAQQYAGSGGAYSGFGAVAVQPDGKLVAAGSATSQTGSDAFAVRFTSSGAQDGSFGSGGVARSTSAINYTPFGTGVPGAAAIAIAPGGDVVTAGTFTNAAVSSAALWAFTAGGAPDSRFGSHGTVVTSVAGSGGSELAGLALDPSGSLVAVGDELTGFGNTYAGIAARYIGFGAPPPPPANSRIGLMGRMGFVSPGGVIGVQVGCFNGRATCAGHIEMSHNGAVVGQTNFRIAPESGGFQNLKLSSEGSRLLRNNRPFHLLPVQVIVTGTNGQRISEVMHLGRWVWGNGSGRAHTTFAPLSPRPPRPSTSRIGLMGMMGFVSPGRVIGVQVGCFNGTATCAGQIKMTHNGVLVGQRSFVIAPESGGFQNLKLSSEGNRLLGENRRFRLLAVNVTVTGTNGQRISEVMHLARWIWL